MWAAVGLLVCLLPCGIACFRAKTSDRLAALEMVGVIVTLTLVFLCHGYHRIAFYDLPLTMAILSFGSGMVFARFLERWH